MSYNKFGFYNRLKQINDKKRDSLTEPLIELKRNVFQLIGRNYTQASENSDREYYKKCPVAKISADIKYFLELESSCFWDEISDLLDIDKK